MQNNRVKTSYVQYHVVMWQVWCTAVLTMPYNNSTGLITESCSVIDYEAICRLWIRCVQVLPPVDLSQHHAHHILFARGATVTAMSVSPGEKWQPMRRYNDFLSKLMATAVRDANIVQRICLWELFLILTNRWSSAAGLFSEYSRFTKDTTQTILQRLEISRWMLLLLWRATCYPSSFSFLL